MTFGVRMGPHASPARWESQRRLFRRGTGTFYRKLQSLKFLVTRDRDAVLAFLRAEYPFDFPLRHRLALLRSFYRITHAVRGYHTLDEILIAADRIFQLAHRPGLTIVEAGAGSGSSTAKLSLVARAAGGRLIVFDSFRGIPENEEKHQLLDGTPLAFRKGAFRGRLSAVKKRVEELGAIELCEFHKGLFEETLPRFDRPVDVVLLDVDLISSTRTCTRHLYPLLRQGGALLSQDGHLQATVDLYSDPEFWRAEVGVEPPRIAGLGVDKLLVVPAPSAPWQRLDRRAASATSR
jgi:O-methyltransferase